MITIEEHLKRYPHARPSTLAQIQKRNETTEKLRREIEQKRKRSFWRWPSWVWRW